MKSLLELLISSRLKVCFQSRQNTKKAAVLTESTARVFTAFARVLLIRYEKRQIERESEK